MSIDEDVFNKAFDNMPACNRNLARGIIEAYEAAKTEQPAVSDTDFPIPEGTPKDIAAAALALQRETGSDFGLRTAKIVIKAYEAAKSAQPDESINSIEESIRFGLVNAEPFSVEEVIRVAVHYFSGALPVKRGIDCRTLFDPNIHCDAERIIAWIDTPRRKRAQMAFTEGLERQIAYRFEDATMKRESAQPDEFSKFVERKIAFTSEKSGKRYEFENTAELIEAFIDIEGQS